MLKFFYERFKNKANSLFYMKNYLKMTLFVVSALFLVVFAGFASAAHPYNTYTYTDKNMFSYNENDHGFEISSSERDTSYSYGNRGYSLCGDVYSWRSYGCGSHYYMNRPYYPDHASYEYDHDAAIKMAFDAYNKGKQYDYQIEKLRIQEEAKKDRYRYGGYGYGYSGGRYYSYGW